MASDEYIALSDFSRTDKICTGKLEQTKSASWHQAKENYDIITAEHGETHKKVLPSLASCWNQQTWQHAKR